MTAATTKPHTHESPGSVSLVMPCHNVAETLPAQLDRLIPQLADRDAELVIVDNNSSDDTAEIARVAASRSPRVRFARATDGQGVAYARNAGVELAHGDRLLFCDADDIVGRGWVDAMAAGLDEHDIVTGALDVESLNDKALRASRGPARRPSFYDLFPVAAGGNMAVTRTAWSRIGALDESLPSLEDMEWSLRARLAGYDIGWLPDARIQYRYRSTANELWRQGWAYGRSRPAIARRLWESTGERPRRLAGLRSWVWLALHIHELLHPGRRSRVAWVAGNRLGQLVGSLDARFLVL